MKHWCMCVCGGGGGLIRVSIIQCRLNLACLLASLFVIPSSQSAMSCPFILEGEVQVYGPWSLSSGATESGGPTLPSLSGLAIRLQD